MPDEVSLAGFDDIPIAQDVTPALSTVRVPLVEMGAAAVRIALEPHGSELRVVHFPTEVVLRESTAPPPEVRGRPGRM